MGVYSWYGNPHAQAIAAVMRRLDLSPEHKIIMPVRYGEHIGVALRYDSAAYCALIQWFKERDFPDEIETDYCTYHLWYNI
jgi:hypothetical protein